jgi:hypothetical protein
VRVEVEVRVVVAPSYEQTSTKLGVGRVVNDCHMSFSPPRMLHPAPLFSIKGRLQSR